MALTNFADFAATAMSAATAAAEYQKLVAAHRAGVPRLVHTYHGFLFHEFQAELAKRLTRIGSGLLVTMLIVLASTTSARSMVLKPP